MTRYPLLSVLVLLVACSSPPIDTVQSQGGTAPDPTGRITGSVVYIGPRPQCADDAVVGRVVLTLFQYDNPPFPEGSATSALNLAIVPGDELFDVSDCQVPDPSDAERAEVIMRSAPFAWPSVALGNGAPVDYQIRAYYDSDADFSPFFSIRNLPTKGDIVGGAVARVGLPELDRIQLPAASEAPLGAEAEGVTVLLGRPVWTERPISRLGATTRPMASDTTIPVFGDMGAPLGDAERDQALWELNMATLDLLSEGENDASLEAAGVNLDYTPTGYAYFVGTIDLNADGEPDPHPILGASLQLPWLTPLVVFQRAVANTEEFAFADNEAAARIPTVRLIPTVRTSLSPGKSVFAPSIQLTIPPVAVVDLDPTNPACRVPYVPPGNITSFYENAEQRPAVCAKLPTGAYAVSIVGGVADGTPMPAAPEQSDVGIVIEGGGLSGQSWTIPNELGDPRQLGDPSLAVPHQGTAGMFLVYDPAPDNQGDCSQAIDPAIGGVRALNPAPVPEACCGPVAHLCGIDLCEPVTVPGTELPILASPVSVVDGVPNCIPFPIPAECCS